MGDPVFDATLACMQAMRDLGPTHRQRVVTTLAAVTDLAMTTPFDGLADVFQAPKQSEPVPEAQRRKDAERASLPTISDDAIIAAVRSGAATPKQVCAVLGATSGRRPRVNTALVRLVRDGRLAKTGRARGVRYAPTGKESPAPKPGPKDPNKYGKGVSMDQRKAESAKKRAAVLEVLQSATHGLTPMLAAKATGYDRATVAWHLRRLLATGRATSSGTGNTVRYHPKPSDEPVSRNRGGQST